MKIAFVTTQTTNGSTVAGRVLPLAQELAQQHDVHVFVHRTDDAGSRISVRDDDDSVSVHMIGKDPFARTETGKKRLAGIRLIGRMKWNAWLMLLELLHLQPDVVVIVKPLPENVAAAAAFNLFTFGKRRIILDVDDFELTANRLTSIWQRAAVHSAERVAAGIAAHITAATPFLKDHFEQLAPGKPATLIPTGISLQKTTHYSLPTTNSLLYLGSISISSGHRVDLLPEILQLVRKEIPNAKLIMAGSGDDVEQLKTVFAAKNVADAVVWAGRFSPSDVPELLSRASVLIDPIDGSITARAKSSYRVVLAAAAGMPVVTSNIGIRPMLLPSALHEKMFAEPETAKSYAEVVIRLLKDPLTHEERSRLQVHSQQFSWQMLGAAYGRIVTA